MEDPRVQCEGRTEGLPLAPLAPMEDREQPREDRMEARRTLATRTPGTVVTTIARLGTRAASTPTDAASWAIQVGGPTAPMVWCPGWLPSVVSPFSRRGC